MWFGFLLYGFVMFLFVFKMPFFFPLLDSSLSTMCLQPILLQKHPINSEPKVILLIKHFSLDLGKQAKDSFYKPYFSINCQDFSRTYGSY